MDTYSFLRELADSWVLLAMFGFFASAVDQRLHEITPFRAIA